MGFEIDLAIKQRVSIQNPSPKLDEAIATTKIQLDAQNMGISIIQEMITAETNRNEPWKPTTSLTPKLTVIR